jgi:hypothetical protein
MKIYFVHLSKVTAMVVFCAWYSCANAQVSVTNLPEPMTPQSLLHVHSNSASGQIFQLTNTTSGYTSPAYGFSIKLDPNFKTIFANQYNNSNASIAFTTNTGSDGERLTIRNNGNIGIGDPTALFKLTVAGQLGLLETGASPSFYTVLQSADLGDQLTFTLPGAYGSLGQVLTTNGSGTMSWSTGEIPLTFSNCLNRIGANVKWGGNLTENTTITQSAAQTLNFINSGAANTVFNLSGTGDLDFQDNGTSVMYITDAGKVGFGTTSPSHQVHMTGNTGSTDFSKVAHIENTSTTTTGQQIWALDARVNHSTDVNGGAAVHGYSTNTAGSVMGVWGESAGQTGIGVYGRADHTTGVNTAIFGHTLSPSGYAGYFLGGRNYFSGDVGFNNDNPMYNIDVMGDFYLDYGTAYGNGMYVTGSTGLALAYFRNLYAGNTWGLSAGCGSSSAGNFSYGIYAYNDGTGYGLWGISANGIGVNGKNTASANYGYLGSADYGVYGSYGTTNYGYLGGSTYGVYGQYGTSGNYGFMGGSSYGVWGYNSTSGNYGYIGSNDYSVFGYLGSTNQGNYALYGYGVNATGEDGTGYGVSTTLGGVKGYNFYGNPYTYGVAGFSYLDYNRSGATFGGNQSGSAPWGCMGYKNSGGTSYGGYFTSYTSGTGKSKGVMINSGLSAWGDLFGADIHGHVYGAYLEGDDYASYANGNVFQNALDIHLQKEENGNNVALYTNVSTEVTVQTCGFATLSGGICQVDFDPSFSAIVSKNSPVIVTITPMGNTGGVYLLEVTSYGFKAVENNNGKSTVQVSYIAIGKRAGYENPYLPEAVLSGDYVNKVTAGLHNDADTRTNSNGLYYENGQLYNGIHPSTLPDPNKPAVDPYAEKIEKPSKEQMVSPVTQEHSDKGDGAAPKEGDTK